MRGGLRGQIQELSRGPEGRKFERGAAGIWRGVFFSLSCYDLELGGEFPSRKKWKERLPMLGRGVRGSEGRRVRKGVAYRSEVPRGG